MKRLFLLSLLLSSTSIFSHNEHDLQTFQKRYDNNGRLTPTKVIRSGELLDLTDLNFEKLDFSNRSLRNMDFQNTTFNNTSFEGTFLLNVDFSQAVFIRPKFNNLNVLGKVDFSNASFFFDSIEEKDEFLSFIQKQIEMGCIEYKTINPGLISIYDTRPLASERSVTGWGL